MAEWKSTDAKFVDGVPAVVAEFTTPKAKPIPGRAFTFRFSSGAEFDYLADLNAGYNENENRWKFVTADGRTVTIYKNHVAAVISRDVEIQPRNRAKDGNAERG